MSATKDARTHLEALGLDWWTLTLAQGALEAAAERDHEALAILAKPSMQDVPHHDLLVKNSEYLANANTEAARKLEVLRSTL